MKKIFRIIKAYAVMCVHFSRVIFQLLYGIWKLSKLKKTPITIFGGSRLTSDSIYMKKAQELAHMLADHNIPVLTGGGPGIMEAASCGAAARKGKIITTIGIGVKGLDEPLPFNKCVKDTIEMDYFFARKWLMVKYSMGFAVFPGGFGTLDELMELLTLIQTHMQKPAPVVLIGIEYWKPFMHWVEQALKWGLIGPEDGALFSITDDVKEAFDKLYCHCKKEHFDIFEQQY